MRAPAGALGGRKVGRFLRKRRGRCGRLGDPALPEARRGWVWPARRSSPTLGTLGEVGMDREDSIPTGRWAAPGAAKAGKGG